MSSRLLAECMERFERHGLDLEFRAYFARLSSRLLASRDVARDLVMLAAQEEEDSSSGALRLLGLLLDEARMGRENDDEHSGGFLEMVETAVEAGLADGAIQQENLIKFVALYRYVGLPMPRSFVLDLGNMAPPPDMENFDLSENLEDMARDITSEGGSAHDLFNTIDTMLGAIPEELQASLAHHIATMDGPLFERCALYILLSTPELVQETTVAGLSERLDAQGLGTETMRFLPMIRGWFAGGPVQAGLDKLIRKARRKAVSDHGDAAAPQIRETIASVTDGVGAQSVAVMSKRGSRNVLAMILIKTGYGIKDGFLISPETEGDAERTLRTVRVEINADDISGDTLRVLLEGALADGLANGHLPDPGFLDVIEACNLFDLRPQELDLPALLHLADPERKIRDASPQALGRWINADVAPEDLTDSWFENTGETRKIIATGRTSRGIETRLWKFLETRRDVWARRFLQTAVILRDGDQLREWKTLTASAQGLMNGRALKRIPLMEDIMYATIEAYDSRMW